MTHTPPSTEQTPDASTSRGFSLPIAAAGLIVGIAAFWTIGLLAPNAYVHIGGFVTFTLVVVAITWMRTTRILHPLQVGVGVAAALSLGITGFLSQPETVNEELVEVPQRAAAPSTQAGQNTDATAATDTTDSAGGNAAVSETAPEPAPAGPVLVAEGSFRDQSHPGSGTVQVIEQEDGSHVLTLRDFSTDPGPDLFVWLSTGSPGGSTPADDTYVNLGGLKGNEGNQQYEIPADVDPSRFDHVVIWCRAFSVNFTDAPLA